MSENLTAPASTVTLGDMTVNRLGFGAMRITGEGVWGPPRDPDGARAVLRRAVELGVNFIDTADAYGPAVSEELIAEALHPYASDLVIATKGGLTRSGPGKWDADCSPDHLREALDASLRRLRDSNVPYEESIGALKELQQAGKIRHLGVSNVGRTQLATARSLVEVVSVQNRYNLLDRGSEAVLVECQEDGIAFIPWFPLGGGPLAAEALERVAERHRATAMQVGLAWLLHRSPVMLPIPGTSSIAHLEENVRAATLQLTAEDLEELEV